MWWVSCPGTPSRLSGETPSATRRDQLGPNQGSGPNQIPKTKDLKSLRPDQKAIHETVLRKPSPSWAPSDDRQRRSRLAEGGRGRAASVPRSAARQRPVLSLGSQPAPREVATVLCLASAHSVRGGGKEGLPPGGAASRLRAGSPFLPCPRQRPPRLCGRGAGALPGLAAGLPARLFQWQRTCGPGRPISARLGPRPRSFTERIRRRSGKLPVRARPRSAPSPARPARVPAPPLPTCEGEGGSTCPTSTAGCGAGRGGEGKQNYQ